MLDILLPRGIRNNNPGNLRLTRTAWQGQNPGPATDTEFVEFIAPLYGLRALMKTLLTYHLKYGLDTVQSLINRYAPPHENATDTYVHAVAKKLGVKRTDRIDLRNKALLIALAAAITVQENGRPPRGRAAAWYDPALYAEAADSALT